jgi:hypothetical protein
MKCSYHSSVDSQEFCTTCNKPLCAECSHHIRGKCYCQDCLVKGAEWAATANNLSISATSPKKAAWCSLIPGMGAVYNGEYLKAVTYFAVFAALCVMGDNIHGIFGFGASVFMIFTIFDAYRTAQAKRRLSLESGAKTEPPSQDRVVIGWGIFLIVLGALFLFQNLIPFHFLSRMWPLVFVGLGAYLVYRSAQNKDRRNEAASGVSKAVAESSKEEAQTIK